MEWKGKERKEMKRKENGKGGGKYQKRLVQDATNLKTIS